MTGAPYAQTATTVEVLIDHFMLYVYGVELADDLGPVYERATKQAWSDARVGGCFGLVAIRVPMQTYIDAPVRVETWAAEPAADEAEWDFVAEFDMPVRGGKLYLQGGDTEAEEVECWDAYYRARFSARGYSAAQPVEASGDFRLQLWAHDSAVEVRKDWHGWPD